MARVEISREFPEPGKRWVGYTVIRTVVHLFYIACKHRTGTSYVRTMMKKGIKWKLVRKRKRNARKPAVAPYWKEKTQTKRKKLCRCSVLERKNENKRNSRKFAVAPYWKENPTPAIAYARMHVSSIGVLHTRARFIISPSVG